MDSRAYIFGDLRIGDLSTNVEEVVIYLGQQISVGWEGGCEIPEPSCKVREIQDPCLGGGGGRYQVPFFVYWRNLVGMVGDLLANIEKMGYPRSNVEGGWRKIPRPMSW